MSRYISRRRFVQSTALTAAAGYFVNPTQAQQSDSPNERLNIACVGATGRAGADIAGVSSQNIIAIADVDSDLLEKGSVKYPNANKYRDFRVMLEKEADKIDAVVVGTTDHTQTQIHSLDNYRRVVELVETGAIGAIQEVHVWAGAVYTGGKFTTGTPAPKHLDWDLWLGPAVERPYSEGVHPFHWRRFWDYGTGALGDFGCHYMDLVHWALKLRNPTTVSAQGPEYDSVSTPAWCIVDYEYPARDKLPPVKLTWYDSGKKPEQLEAIIKRQPLDQDGKPMNVGSGQLFVGEKGLILSGYTQRSLIPAEDFSDFKAPEAYIPASIGHHEEWVNAIKTGGPTTCNFDYSGALTESVLLGTVAYRSGEKIEWDSANLKVTNSEKAQQFVHKEYRQGWTL
ncbi:MAG: gfo/Idh/MocA family oxidoreductase [Planctomycetia bacterium]|nr:gfo/Idh/MocA family oxidoreductase [Planctomycetia bacterium]